MAFKFFVLAVKFFVLAVFGLPYAVALTRAEG